MSDFYKYFKENMDGLGLPAPETLFASAQMAVTNALIFLGHIDKFGATITVRELIVAGTRLERLGVVATTSAAFYVGAVVGSIAVATGRNIVGRASIADVLLTANKYWLNRPWLVVTLHRWPGIYQRGRAGRNTYRFHALPQ